LRLSNIRLVFWLFTHGLHPIKVVMSDGVVLFEMRERTVEVPEHSLHHHPNQIKKEKRVKSF